MHIVYTVAYISSLHIFSTRLYAGPEFLDSIVLVICTSIRCTPKTTRTNIFFLLYMPPPCTHLFPSLLSHTYYLYNSIT